MKSEIIASFLRRIPQSNQDAIPIEHIAENTNTDILYGYALMLQTIGLVQLDNTKRIKARSPESTSW